MTMRIAVMRVAAASAAVERADVNWPHLACWLAVGRI